MRISAIAITNFKRLVDVEIAPEADRTLVLIGGKNAMGKTSLMDALSAAFGGADSLPVDPVRHGAEAAEIRVELDGGALTVRRTIKDGKSTLELRDADGRLASPQARLDKLVGARFIDPLAFLALDAKEQRAHLMKLIPNADRIAQLDVKRANAFAKRTELGRDLKKAEGELARLPIVEPGAPIDVAALNVQLRAFNDQQRAGDQLVMDHATADAKLLAERGRRDNDVRAIASIDAELVKLRARIADIEADRVTFGAAIVARDEVITTLAAEVMTAREAMEGAATVWGETLDARKKLDADLARADQHNRAVYAAEANAQRRTDAAAAVAKLTTDIDGATQAIELVDGRKRDLLAAAKLPVEDLAIAEDAVLFHGVPLAQASGAEQLRVALAVALAGSPNLRDVWVRDGALLDDESLAALAREAAAAGVRCWVERVGDRDPGAIVIHEGRIAVRATEAA